MLESKNNGNIIIIIAPSGAGKSTLLKRLLKEFPEIIESVSCTTRPIREGEIDGVSYNFLTVEEFNTRRDAGDFLEYAQVHSNFYGTSKEFVNKKLAEGKTIIFDLDVQGADNMIKHLDDICSIYIAPPSLEELKARLIKRGTETEETINIRIKNAEQELKRKNDYKYVVYNNDLEQAYIDLKTIVANNLAKGIE